MTGTGILVYGSLLQREVLAGTLSEGTVADAIPVTVDGYRRSFNKPSGYRRGESDETAILNAEPDPGAWLNALLVPDVPDEEFERYRQREHRYELVDVPAADVSPYDSSHEGTIRELDERLIATSEGTLDEPEPIPYYVADCVDGAAEWGDSFLTDFLVTTHRV